MRILVCVKTVPDVKEIRFDPVTGAMLREGAAAILNPYDLVALEAGLRLAEEHGGKVEAVSMGPASAAIGLRTAIAMGAAEGHLLVSKRFAGGDVLATAHTLAAFLRDCGGYDMIICGKHSADGDTGQVGPALAELLGLPHAGCVSRVVALETGHLRVEQRFDGYAADVRIPLPCLLVAENDLCFPRMASLMGTVKAKRHPLREWNGEGSGLAFDRCGFAGSATRVVRIHGVRHSRRGKLLEDNELGQLAETLLQHI